MKKYVIFLLLIMNAFYSVSAIAQPNASDLSFNYAKKLYDDQIFDIAAEQFRDFAIKNPLSPKAAEALLMAGNSYYKIREYDKAQKEYFYLVLKYPDARDIDQAQFKIAQCFESLENFAAAANAYKQVQIFYPKSNLAQESLFMSARMNFQAQDYRKAIETLHEFLELFPVSSSSQEAQLLLIEALINSNNYNRAKLEIDKILGTTQSGKYNADALLKKANLARQFGHVNDAENGYEALVEKYNKNMTPEIVEIVNEALYQLSEIYQQKNMFEKSNETIYKISNYQTNIKSLSALADNNFSLRNYAQAIDNYKKVIASSDTNYLLPAYFGLGKSFQGKNEFMEAIHSYDYIIQHVDLKKDRQNIALYENSFQNICFCYINLNQADTGIGYLKKYKTLTTQDRNFENIDYQIAYLLETKSNDFERAIRAYYDFIDLYPKSKLIDEAGYGLARCYEKVGNTNQALADYSSFLRKFPASSYYFDVQKRIDNISTFFPASKSNALNKFSGILQQLSLNKSNPQTFYQIALINFNDLKDYQSCLNMFKQYEPENDKQDEVIYYIARCYQFLGEKDSVATRATYLDSASIYYSKLITDFPNSQWTDDAAFHQIEISLLRNSAIAAIQNTLESFIVQYNDSPFLEEVYYKLGILQLSTGINTPIDSLEIYRNFENVIVKFPQSSLGGGAMYYQAVVFYNRKNYPAAEERLNSVIRRYPASPFACKAYYMSGKIADHKQEYAKSIERLQYIIDNYYYSDYVDSAYLDIGNFLLKQEKTTDALIYLKRLYQEYYVPDQIYLKENFKYRENVFQETVFNLGSLYELSNDKEQAIQFYQEYLKKFPRGKYADKVLFSLGALFDKNKRESQLFAIDYLKQIEKDFPSSNLVRDSYLNIGDIYFKLKEYQKANEYYLKLTDSSPSEELRIRAEAKVIQGLYRLRQVNQADEKLKLFERQNKDEKSLIAEIKLEKGNYFLELKEFKEAENIYKEVRSDGKRSAEGAKAEFLLGKMNFILNKDKEALEIFAELIENAWDEKILPEVYITLGNFYYLQAKQFDNAILAYKKAIEYPGIDEQNLIIGMNNLIKCYSDIQLWDSAIKLSREYIEKFPVNDDTFEKKIQIGYFYYRLKEYDYAIQLFKSLKPEADLENEPRIQYWIGECYFEKGLFQEAVQEYLKIVYLSRPTKLLGQYRVTAQYQSGVAYIKLGKLDNAKQLFQKIIREQGAESVFGKPAKAKIEEIELLKTRKN